jgi:hypothetical protein
MIVLFPNGRDPTAQPVSTLAHLHTCFLIVFLCLAKNALPPLDTEQAIKGLNDQYARRYVQGYYPNENLLGLGPSARLLRIVAAIGAHQDILR